MRPKPPLLAGLAVAAYGRQMARRVAWTGCLAWNSRWLEGLLAPHRPLRVGPLLGTTLAALATEADAPPEERAEPARHPSRLTHTRREEVPRSRPVPATAGLETQSAAGVQGRSSAPAASPHWTAGAPAPSRDAARVIADLPRRASPALLAPFAAASQAAPGGISWRDSLPDGRSASRGAMQSDIAARTAARDRRAIHVEPRSTRAAASTASFETARATRLEGPTAPLSLLTRSAGLAPGTSPSDATPRDRASATAPPRREDTARPAPQPPPSPTRPAADPPVVTEGGAPFAPSLWGMLDYPIAASASAPPPPDPETTVRVVNPTLAPRLPFLTPSEPGGPPDLPIAAATARQGAWAEEAAEEDLEAFAAKLKRILNEEARRHGIGV